jgi:putative endonuclease
MSRDVQELGELGERYAEEWLVERGWQILARRFRNGHRDLDLVARQGGDGVRAVVAFVEVKARREARFGAPIEAVNWRKQQELIRSAQVWISRFGQPGEAYRFDVIGVLIGGSGVRIQHVENAFSLPWRG